MLEYSAESRSISSRTKKKLQPFEILNLAPRPKTSEAKPSNWKLQDTAILFSFKFLINPNKQVQKYYPNLDGAVRWWLTQYGMTPVKKKLFLSL